MENEMKDVAERTMYSFHESIKNHIDSSKKSTVSAAHNVAKFPNFVIRHITKRVLLLGVFILISTVILTFLLAWLVLKVTTPESVIYSFVHLNFDVYAGIMLFLLVVLIIYDLFSIVTGFYDNKFNKKRFFIVNAVLILSIIGIFIGSYVLRHPVLESNYPDYGEALVDYTEPLEVVFNLPVRVGDLKPNIVPELVGKWVWEPYLGMKGISRVGHFYPEVTAFPEERFILYITGINKLTDGNKHEYGFVFQAPPLPTIVSSNPKNTDENFSRDKEIVLQLDRDSSDMVNWNFLITPTVEFDTEYTEDNKIKLKPKALLSQGQVYKIDISYRTKRVNIVTGELFNLGEETILPPITFTTAKEPLISTFYPMGTIRPTDRVQVGFSEEMDRESVEEHFVIEPKVEGEFIWTDDKTLRFENEVDFAKDTSYKVTFSEGMKSKYNGVIETAASYEFKTAGKVTIKSTSPTSGSTNNSEYSEVRIEFDQEVDGVSVGANLRITPSISGNIVWEGNTFVYKPIQPLSFETTYEFKFLSGIKAVYGMDSDTDLSMNFRVRSNVYVFNIPLYYQPEGSFSCNIYTAKMILAWKGYQSDATGLIAEIGYDANRAGNSWTGNPYAEYVGNADGSWGYGVYYQPIQRIFTNRGIYSEAHVGWNVSELAQQVQQGRPVVIWRYNGVSSGNNISWTSDDGTYVHAFSGMHGGVISGFMGPASNPTHLYVNDPWFGQFWMDVSTFNYYWSFTNNMAVVVH